MCLCQCADLKDHKNSQIVTENIQDEAFPFVEAHCAAQMPRSNPLGALIFRADTLEPVAEAQKDPTLHVDIEQSKKELREMISKFLQNAISGIDCTEVECNSGERFAARYHVDRQLSKMTVLTAHGDEQCWNIASIKEVYSYDDCQEMVPNPMPSMSDEEKPCAVVVQGTDKVFLSNVWLCLLLQSEKERDDFCTSLRILRNYKEELSDVG